MLILISCVTHVGSHVLAILDNLTLYELYLINFLNLTFKFVQAVIFVRIKRQKEWSLFNIVIKKNNFLATFVTDSAMTYIRMFTPWSRTNNGDPNGVRI